MYLGPCRRMSGAFALKISPQFFGGPGLVRGRAQRPQGRVGRQPAAQRGQGFPQLGPGFLVFLLESRHLAGELGGQGLRFLERAFLGGHALSHMLHCPQFGLGAFRPFAVPFQLGHHAA